MQSEIQEILDLQEQWTWENTPAMQRRGVVIRHECAEWLRVNVTGLAMNVHDIRVEGRDGTGRKTEIPWVRVYSESRSPSATTGFYAVYLFSGGGQFAYLSLNQGTTRWENGEFRPRSPSELFARVQWARAAVQKELISRSDLYEVIDLEATHGLGRGYELGNIAAIRYHSGNIPNDRELAADLAYMCRCLEEIYASGEGARSAPGDPSPEMLDALETIDVASRPRSSRKRAGLRLSAADRQAIERRAVHAATEYLQKRGFSVKDVGATESYDLDARRDGQRLYVEVKGTTSDGDEVVLTRNEVKLNSAKYPATALFVLNQIHLDRSVDPPSATGGRLSLHYPWLANPESLAALAFSYKVPALTPIAPLDDPLGANERRTKDSDKN